MASCQMSLALTEFTFQIKVIELNTELK